MCPPCKVHGVHYQFTVSHNTRSYIATTFPDSSTRSTKADQLTVDFARRAHQSPGRLVDEDGLRGLPLAQRTGQGQSGVWPSLCGSLFASRNRFTVDGERTACVLPVKSVTGLFVTLCRQDCGSRWRHTSIDQYIRIARTRACTRTVYRVKRGKMEHNSRLQFCRRTVSKL